MIPKRECFRKKTAETNRTIIFERSFLVQTAGKSRKTLRSKALQMNDQRVIQDVFFALIINRLIVIFG